MKNLKHISFLLFLILSLTAFVFTSCSEEDPIKETTSTGGTDTGGKTGDNQNSDSTIAVTSISMNSSVLTLAVGGSYTLTVSVSPTNATNKTVVWTSSDASKATVNLGNVSAIASGTTIITAKVGNKTATCTVTVQPAVEVTLPVIVTAPATTITSNSAVLGGEITNAGGASITSKGVCYSNTNPNPTLNDASATVTSSNNVFSAKLTGLSASKTYYVRAFAINSKGIGYGEVISFTTIAQAPVVGVVIGGVTWAPSNLDLPGTFADTQASAGKLYQWNRDTGWNTSGSYIVGWNTTGSISSLWSSSYDPSPSGWRLPTAQELQTLVKYYKGYEYRDGVMGHTFSDGNAEIFLPVPGWRFYLNQGMLTGGASVNGIQSFYWSSEESSTEQAHSLSLYKDGAIMSKMYKAAGGSIRCVAIK